MKNPRVAEKGRIRLHDIGDYLTREDKLRTIASFSSIEGIRQAGLWSEITPNEHFDWVKQRSSDYGSFMPLGDKREPSSPSMFNTYARGVETGRDPWCYNASREGLQTNVKSMIATFNAEVSRFISAGKPQEKSFLLSDPKRISWSALLHDSLQRCRTIDFDAYYLRQSAYRPFTMQWSYLDRLMNQRVSRISKMFPQHQSDNIVICVTGVSERKGFSVLATRSIPNLHMLDTGQCFPLNLFDAVSDEKDDDLLSQSIPAEGTARHGITDVALEHFRSKLQNSSITKDEVFYYVYGLLHSVDYRERYADDLAKGLPRIPCVSSYADFVAFSIAGRSLADLHVNYESAEPYAVTFVGGGLFMADLTESDYRVEKMRFGKKDKVKDRTTVIYNSRIIITDIPLAAYEYVVNGRPALESVMEGQAVWTDKASGIVNDPNRYAIETAGDPAYPLKLFQRVITVSLRTMEIVRSLPSLTVTLTESAQISPTVTQSPSEA